MKNKGFFAGLLCGALIFGGTTAYAVGGIMATLSQQSIYVDGQRAYMTAYSINGNNYVKLRDVGKAVGFNVSWDDANHCVQIDSKAPYTNDEVVRNAAGTVTLPTDGSRYVPEVGDLIRCGNDSTNYKITDVSKWDKSMFAEGPLGPLPSATCDWSQFPELALPAPDARHFTTNGQEFLFLRNLYETRRMQYTLYNMIGSNSETWQNGKLVLRKDGTPLARVRLSIEGDDPGYSFWPWRESQLHNLFDDCPAGEYQVEAWDVFKNGAFQYTEYYVLTK